MIVAALALGAAAPALAQTPPAAAPRGPAPLAIPNPNYISIPMEIEINKPAAEVWKRVGKYCDISEWLQIAAGCKMISGTEGEVGSVRSVGNEILVGKTELSYTYTQPVREGRPYNLYHGTLEARPMGKKTKMVYTLMYDNSFIPGDEEAKKAEIQRRRTAFERGLANMKILAEGGKLPPPPTPPKP
jgi:hypothetical protein